MHTLIGQRFHTEPMKLVRLVGEVVVECNLIFESKRDSQPGLDADARREESLLIRERRLALHGVKPIAVRNLSLLLR